MEFRLTYAGKLLAHRTPVKESRARHKHDIRRSFHGQLKRLWEVHTTLVELGRQKMLVAEEPTYLAWAAQNYARHGFKWVPLVTERMSLMCRIKLLMLRQGKPGQIVSKGDIDNRLKTIFDALMRPKDLQDLGGTAPVDGEDPFFVLLEDDELITHTSVETDTLLEPINGDENDVRLVLTINVRPYRVGLNNIEFAA